MTTQPLGNNGPFSPAPAQEVGLYCVSGKDNYNARDGDSACIVSQVYDREWWCATHRRDAELCDRREP